MLKHLTEHQGFTPGVFAVKYVISDKEIKLYEDATEFMTKYGDAYNEHLKELESLKKYDMSKSNTAFEAALEKRKIRKDTKKT